MTGGCTGCRCGQSRAGLEGCCPRHYLAAGLGPRSPDQDPPARAAAAAAAMRPAVLAVPASAAPAPAPALGPAAPAAAQAAAAPAAAAAAVRARRLQRTAAAAAAPAVLQPPVLTRLPADTPVRATGRPPASTPEQPRPLLPLPLPEALPMGVQNMDPTLSVVSPLQGWDCSNRPRCCCTPPPHYWAAPWRKTALWLSTAGRAAGQQRWPQASCWLLLAPARWGTGCSCCQGCCR